MKNIIILPFLYTILYSCDISRCYDYYIENKTDKNLELVKFSRDDLRVKSEKINILANDSYLESGSCSFTNELPPCYYKDSIQIRSNGAVLKTYYKNDTIIGKSIYNIVFSWKEVESKKNYKKYTFEITEEDLKQ